MAQRNIDFGTFPNDPDADAIRTAFEKVQQNFTELFSGLDEQAVLSVTGQPGGGITAFPTTGNVVLTANLACLQVRTSTLSIGRDANGSQSAVITQSSQELIVDLPANIVNVANANFSGTVSSNAFVANNSISSSNTISATGNITGGNLTTSGVIVATGNANVGNVGATTGVFTANISVANNISATNVWANSGTINAANANIVGNITSGNANLGNLVTANFFSGNGSLLTGVIAAPGNLIVNGTSQVFVSLSGNVTTTAAGFNTQVVTTTGVNVAGYGTFTGNLTAANANLGNATTANYFIGNLYGTANSATTATSATTAGTVTTAAQPNITSVGTLTSLAVTGNANVGNVNATGTVIAPTIEANTSGTGQNFKVGDDTWIGDINIADTMSIQGQQNAANGFIIFGNNDTTAKFGRAGAGPLSYTGAMAASANITTPQFISNVATGTAPFIVTSTTQVANLSVATAGTATTAGTVTTAAQPNITSVGTLTSLGVNGTVTAVAFTANTGVFTGNGNGLSSLVGANVTGTVANATFATSAGTATTAGTVTTAAQPNITSVGTLTSLAVTGNLSSGNLSSGNANLGNAATANFFIGSGNNLSNIQGANVTGTVSSATSATTAGTVTTNAQPNITSVGTLSSLSVTGNISAGNANLGNLATANFFQGDGSLLTNITVAAGSLINNGTSNVVVDASGNVRTSVAGNANILVVTGTGANITGTANITGNLSAGNVSATLLTGTLTTAAQPNITSVGTLTGLTVNGTSNLGPNSNVIITGGVNGAFLKTDGSGNLIWDTATLVPAQGTNSQVIFNDGGTTYAGNSNLTFNKTTGNLSVGGLTVTNSATFGNVFANSGTVRGSLLTGTLTTAAQPNVTSLGTLTSLIVNGNINAGNVSGGNVVTANFVTGTLTTAAQPNITSLGTLTSLGVNNTITAVNITANTGVFTGNANGLTNIPAANVTGTVANATFATTAGSATTAGTVTTNAQPNITSVGTLTSLLITGNAIAGNIYANSGTIGASSLTGTLTTAAQPNVTSLGTLTSLGVNGTITGVNITANTGVFTGNGNGLSSIVGANVTGAVAFATTANAVAGANVSGTVANATFATSAGSATTAGTVTTAAQPNITSTGTLTSLTVSGNITAQANVTVTGYRIRSVNTGISAAGTVQGNATAITKEMNVVSTVAPGAGVILPAIAGAVITITNTSVNALLVYPAVNGIINSQAANAAYSQPAGATLQFIAPTATQWYTVGATFA